MSDTQFLRLFGSIFVGIGSILALAGIISGFNTRSFIATSVTTQGTVIDLIQRSSTRNRTTSSRRQRTSVQPSTLELYHLLP
ncbi:hypothetical protein [Nostoc parmelioides]|uniref:Uncharacterized protein n=1 Tax=Nostoc parmelioides FACHB-3921 TaxID=2692909 RepID=A0ABR8B7Z8_9NOSO|nr:hypothetical protein [Nostoc parmelioides]MBD2249829.1 hypothetical protein [Nostoc parmelioides FACHB-3921]